MSMKIWINKNKTRRIRNKKYTRKQQALRATCTGVYLEIKKHKKIKRVVIKRIIQRYFEQRYIQWDGKIFPREEYAALFDPLIGIMAYKS